MYLQYPASSSSPPSSMMPTRTPRSVLNKATSFCESSTNSDITRFGDTVNTSTVTHFLARGRTTPTTANRGETSKTAPTTSGTRTLAASTRLNELIESVKWKTTDSTTKFPARWARSTSSTLGTDDAHRTSAKVLTSSLFLD